MLKLFYAFSILKTLFIIQELDAKKRTVSLKNGKDLIKSKKKS
jgi:hypothetical protein